MPCGVLNPAFERSAESASPPSDQSYGRKK